MHTEIYPWLTPLWQQLNAQIQQQRLPHAMLFNGPQGVGKTRLAQTLASALLCQRPVSEADATEQKMVGQACGHCESCLLLAADTHPDFYPLQPTPPKTSKSRNPVLSIRIDTIRDLCRRLSQTSQLSGYRIVVIQQADKMNTAAANSLLKTLEEPGENTLLILTSAVPGRLPVTIRSRCQSLGFCRPNYAQVEPWLMRIGQFSHSPACQQAFRLAHHAPLIALKVEAQTEQRELLSRALLARFNRQNVLDYSLKLSQCDKQQMLGWMLDWVNDLVYLATLDDADYAVSRLIHQQSKTALQQLASRLDKKRLFSLQTQILQTLQQGSIALNPQLLWDNLLLSWDSL